MNTEQAIEIIKCIYPSEKEIKTGEYPQVADALDVAIAALRAQQERENPLTLEELLVLDVGRIVYCTPLNDWAKTTCRGLVFFGTEDSRSWPEIKADYGKTWLAYDHEPTERCEGEG